MAVYGMCAIMYGRRLFSSVFAFTDMRDMYAVPWSMSFLGFWVGTMLANFHMCGIMLLLRAVFNILVKTFSSLHSFSNSVYEEYWS